MGLSAQAQNIWTLPTMPWVGFGIPISTKLRTPVAGVVWGLRQFNYAGGPGSPITDTELYTTPDDGQTWQHQVVATYGLNSNGIYAGDMWAVDAQHAWLVMYNNGVTSLRRTTTGSANMTVLPTNAVSEHLGFIRFFNTTDGFAITFSGTSTTLPLYHTTDGGSSWLPLVGAPTMAPGDYVVDCVVLGNNVWLPTHLGTVLRSTDAGHTWSTSTTTVGLPIRGVSFSDPLHGLAYAANATQVSVTADGGQTWTLTTPSGPMRYGNIQGMPGAPGVYLSVGPSSHSYDPTYDPTTDLRGTAVSTDNGATWRTVENVLFHEALSIQSPTNIWAGGYYGSAEAARYTGAALASQASQLVKRGLDVYPNPTAGPVTIASALPMQRVKVYNALGQLQLQKELSAPATSADLSGLPAGVYQVVAEGKAGSQAQRLSVVH
ncbi:hypothetical protein GCM10027044_31610 [Hymenobacter ruber]